MSEAETTHAVLVLRDMMLASKLSEAIKGAGVERVTTTALNGGRELKDVLRLRPVLLLLDGRDFTARNISLLENLRLKQGREALTVLYVKYGTSPSPPIEAERVMDDILQCPEDTAYLGIRCRTLLSLAQKSRHWREERENLLKDNRKQSKKATDAKLLLRQAEKRLSRILTEKQVKSPLENLSAMNHELRTPLNAILGYSEILM